MPMHPIVWLICFFACAASTHAQPSTDVEQALQFGNSEMTISVIKDATFDLPDKPQKMEDHLFSEKFACPICNISLPEVEPRIFSFNTPHGACPNCSGLGRVLSVDPELVFNNNLTNIELTEIW